jgi:CheY-like chemotaxis protein
MQRASHIEFELPNDLVVRMDDDAGDTQPQALADVSDTLPGELAPAASAGAIHLTEAVIVAAAVPTGAIIAPKLPTGPLPYDGPQAKRVLVVDDDITARLYLRSRLMLRGHAQLFEATSGEEAFLLVQTQRFDALLLDVDMGSQSGYETCRAVRQWVRQNGGKQPRIYIITSRTGVIDKMRAKMAGADAFLSKPPHPGELSELLAQL